MMNGVVDRLRESGVLKDCILACDARCKPRPKNFKTILRHEGFRGSSARLV
ncbi:MAG: hypothetical protein QXL67_04110 [Candidatus Bathyarchaeia archaeon]